MTTSTQSSNCKTMWSYLNTLQHWLHIQFVQRWAFERCFAMLLSSLLRLTCHCSACVLSGTLYFLQLLIRRFIPNPNSCKTPISWLPVLRLELQVCPWCCPSLTCEEETAWRYIHPVQKHTYMVLYQVASVLSGYPNESVDAFIFSGNEGWESTWSSTISIFVC
jgi:hypothetical protein